MTNPSRTFVLTFDFEDWHQLVYRRIGRADWRDGSADFDRHLASVLDWLDDLGVTATFFVAGVAAERHPDALRDVAAGGHELACHGFDHVRAFQQSPGRFREDVLRCVDTLAKICGVTPVGYRAPWFSITRKTVWAHDVLRELGFRYDSSLYDSPFVPERLQPIPAHPFRVRDELWEFPIAVWRSGPAGVPIGGGAYWRVFPRRLLLRALESVAERSLLPVLYFHPYEWADEWLQVTLPLGATRKEQLREVARRVYKNTRRHVIPLRLQDAAERFRLVAFRDVLGSVGA
jgi:polysaccharide deacetylase family protein (PEP-CTERM system associated)